MKKLTYLLVLMLCLCGCSKAPIDTPPKPQEVQTLTPTPTTPPTPEPPKKATFVDPLTGLVGDVDLRTTTPVSVMINNFKAAIPHAGIGDAAIIYEAQVEGEITRLMAVFNDYASIPKIGPVRSSRSYFVDLAYNHSDLYVHFGGSPGAYSAIKSTKIRSIDGIALEGPVFYRDKERKKQKISTEHTAFTTGQMILDGMKIKKYDPKVEKQDDFFAFSPNALKGEVPATQITVKYSKYISPVYKYDENKKSYKREQFGSPHIDENTGEQIDFKNVFVLFAKQGAIPKDEAGRIEIDVKGGNGIYFTNGTATEITYKKPSVKEKMKFYDKNGKEIQVNVGKSFINIVSLKTEILYQ